MTSYFGWYIRPKDAKKLIWACIRMEDNLSRQAHSELPRAMAYEYRELLRDNMVKGRFTGSWGSGATRYHPRYRDWKYQSLGGNLGFWILKGELLNLKPVYP